VTDDAATLPLAVLDTSFWTVAYQAEVVANCLDLFQIVVPRAVEAEIRSIPIGLPHREYPYATLFRHLRGQLLDPPSDAPGPLNRFGAGEAEAITLAQSLDALLLINELPASTYARTLGVVVVAVPDVVVALRIRGVIGDRAARRKIELIEPNTASEMIEAASRELDRLASTGRPHSDAT
jgi:hypothetical protein